MKKKPISVSGYGRLSPVRRRELAKRLHATQIEFSLDGERIAGVSGGTAITVGGRAAHRVVTALVNRLDNSRPGSTDTLPSAEVIDQLVVIEKLMLKRDVAIEDLVAAQRKLADLEIPDLPLGVEIVWFSLKFGGPDSKTYAYAARRAGGRWYTTGSTCPPAGYTWAGLVRVMREAEWSSDVGYLHPEYRDARILKVNA